MKETSPRNKQTDEIVYPQPIDRYTLGSLTNAQLLALLLGSGTLTDDTLSASQSLLDAHENCLLRMATATCEELTRIPGITPRKAMNLLAALELARRKPHMQPAERPRIANSASAYEELRPVLCELPHEEFWLLLLDRGIRLLKRVRLSIGGIHGTVADPKCIFKLALDHRASALVVAHNHPSGQLRPSEEDIRLTRKLVEAGRLLDTLVQDHLIVTDTGYYSFADNGILV